MARRVRTTRRLEVWLKDTSVALFVLNAHRRLVFFNAGCERLTGWVPSAVLGQVCEFVSEADPHSAAALLASLAPPANVWRGDTVTVPAVVAHRELDPVTSQIHFFPLTDTDNRVQAALGIIQSAATPSAASSVSTTQRLHVELALLRNSLRKNVGVGALIGQCAGMRRVFDQLQLAQRSSLPLLFVGETGTGREHMARVIHAAGERSDDLFVPLDCRRMPAELLESTFKRILDSHAGAGFLPGTLYLNQIDTLSRDLQYSVLRLIQSENPSAPRVMAAASKPLEPLIESEHYLEEFVYALTPMVITVPPLRSRENDMELLAQYFLEECNRNEPQQVTEIDEEVWERFRRYNWPGNVGELRTVVWEARKTCAGFKIESADLPFRFRAGVSGQAIGPRQPTRVEPLDPLLMRVEREQIELALKTARDNKAKAAELLGITRPRLYRRMEVLGIVDADSAASDNTTSVGTSEIPTAAIPETFEDTGPVEPLENGP
ncbi:sigma 54-interacting transcriptional regulator [Schlesneria sp. DSM 10557]|uniref:sigma 54-interacting transcriptional regulator n=1 Tax=Schlesneria sp. DSM 10557 TaxID=3044399 RepID=UPI0035A12122